MKVAFFTPRSIEPLHPRLVIFNNYFNSKGIKAAFINKSDNQGSFRSRINWISLWFFDLYAILRCKPLLKEFDIIFVTDLKYLPLSRAAKKMNKVVIYDTIDHNVHLRFYQLQHKIRSIQIFKNLIIGIFKKIEIFYASKYCDIILVNSDSLKTYFGNSARTLYYYSPFESIRKENASSNPAALLYVGIFSNEKGANRILEIQHKLNIPLFVYGKVGSAILKERLLHTTNVFYTPNISMSELRNHIIELLDKYFLFGLSLIHPAHYSYEVQEANKDIDYLALGVPLIGNYRLTTKEKIDAGCGLYFDDTKLPEKVNNVHLRKTLSTNCKNYYARKYASPLFYHTMESVFKNYAV